MVRYAGARKTLEARAQRESERRRLEGKLAEFFLPLSMSIPREPRRALAELRDHRKTWDALAQEAAQLDREIPECRARLQEELSRPLAGSREDPELLRGEIARLKKSEEAASEQLLRMLQQREQLADRLEALSSAEQELEFWKEKLARDRKQAELLDETMACLDSAREELRNNYVGPLRRAFAGYMEKLMDEPGEKILMTADFHVRLERSGAARELGFFSAGQTDLVMLCMRLALVDALFRQEKPVVILDDPFVNLDDTHTRQALELLEELSQDRQILYLVCNSSRDF
jgi:DNA repair exonuclease SbcCD ATPase subunit